MEAKARILPWVVFLASASWPLAAAADPPVESVEFGVKDARARFQRGVEFYLEGSYDAALAELTKAYQISPNYRVLYNLAQVQHLRHDYVAALRLFNDYLKQGGADIAEDRRKQVETILADLKTRVATLTIAGTPGSELTIDDEPSGRLPTSAPVLVNPGKHRLQLRKSGYETLTHQLTIASAEAVRLELPLRAVPHVVAPPPAETTSAPREHVEVTPTRTTPQRADSPSRAPMWISLVATAALTGGAVTFGILAQSADDELGRELKRVPASRSEVDDLRSRIERNAALCDGLAAGAIVSAGLFLYFAFSGSDATESDPNPSGVIATPTGILLRDRF